MLHLMSMNRLDRERRLRLAVFRFEVQILCLVDAVIIGGAWNLEVGFCDLRGTALRIVHMHDRHRCRLLMDDGKVLLQIVLIGLVDLCFQLHAPMRSRLSCLHRSSSFSSIGIVNHQRPHTT